MDGDALTALRDDLKRRQAEGETLIKGLELSEMLSTVMKEIAPLCYAALLHHPTARNFLKFEFVDDAGNPTFDVVIHRRGGKYPDAEETP